MDVDAPETENQLMLCLSSIGTGRVHNHLLEKVFVRVLEVERRLFEIVVDDTREVCKQMSVGGGRGNQQEALSGRD